eukprot:scaffold426_cov219-Amphora_coffeaeformis.AAC.43
MRVLCRKPSHTFGRRSLPNQDEKRDSKPSAIRSFVRSGDGDVADKTVEGQFQATIPTPRGSLGRIYISVAFLDGGNMRNPEKRRPHFIQCISSLVPFQPYNTLQHLYGSSRRFALFFVTKNLFPF